MTREGWLAAALRAVPERVLAWRGEPAVRESLGAWLDVQLARTADSEFATRFAASCPWPGAHPADYLQGVVVVPGGEALVGIRFLGGKTDFRFVDLLASTGTDDPEVLACVASAALAHSAVFNPGAVRVRQPSERAVDPPGWRVELDQAFLVGRLDELASRPGVDPGLRLESAEPAEAAAFARRAYEAAFRGTPALAARVTPSAPADLRASREEGLLAWLLADGERAGVIALTRGSDAELDGYFVEEEAIAPAFRGRGLAAVAQRLAVESLAPTSPEALLFGTIDAANEASMRTAERVGRVRTGAHRFLFPPA